jgi:hypothetical protein
MRCIASLFVLGGRLGHNICAFASLLRSLQKHYVATPDRRLPVTDIGNLLSRLLHTPKHIPAMRCIASLFVLGGRLGHNICAFASLLRSLQKHYVATPDRRLPVTDIGNLLSRLLHTPKHIPAMRCIASLFVLGGRLELPTPPSSGECSNQLSYPSIYEHL